MVERSKSVTLLYILMALGAAVGIISGIGSTCVVFEPKWWLNASFAVVEDFQMVWLICYFVTWLVGIMWIVLFWALLSGKSWFYKTSIVNCVLGIITGFIPAGILLYEWWDTYGEAGMVFTPSWFRTIGNAIILVFLLIPSVKSSLATYMEERAGSPSTSVGGQVSNFAILLFCFGFLLIIQPILMPMTHSINADVYMYTGYWLEAFQYYVGTISIALGIVFRFIGQIISSVYTPKATPV